jgi:integrase
MPTISLTARTIDALKPTSGVPQMDYWDSTLKGFGVRVSASGRKSWIAFYRLNGRVRRLTLGTYPALSLADAREHARDALHAVAKGTDPASEKKAAAQAASFHDLAQEYLDRYARLNKKSWREDERILHKDVLPDWGRLRANEITRRHVLLLLDQTVERGAPVHANRILALVRKVFNFGIERDIVDKNPCTRVARPTVEKARDRVLTPEEIRTLWNGTMNERPLAGSLIRLYLLTAQRGGEIRNMCWADIDLESRWWRIPGEKTKNGLGHRVPLNDLAAAELERLRGLSSNSPFVFSPKRSGDAQIKNIQATIQRLRKDTGVDFVGHDLRRTAASHMAGMGIPRLVISKILNHAEGGVTRVYDRHSYDQEKQDAMNAWGKRILEIIK